MAVLRWVWSIIKGALNTLARAVVILILLFVVLAVIGSGSSESLPQNMVLELDVRMPVEDKVPPDIFGLPDDTLSLMDMVMGLDAAARDDRVKGLFLRVGSGDLSVPQAEELRESLKRFQSGGKFVIAHSQSFYSGGLGDFGLAAAADEIWMQPASAFFASGTSTTTLFFRGLFDNIDAEPQFVQRYEYKNAANIFTETGFTPEHLEATGRLLQSWYDTATTEIAADLGIEAAALKGILDQSPLLVDEAIGFGLVNATGYDDDARNAALVRAGDGAEIAEFSDYVSESRNAILADGPVIAFVHAAGEIVEGEVSDPFGTSVVIAGDDFAQAVREASEDEDVQAILLRVDSPGGSAIASDQILDALKKAQALGKPVVVSMGSVAASGGYYISLAADRIVAHPGTITGSIGVLWGKVAAGGSLALLGVENEELGVGANALFFSGLNPWTEEQLAKVEAQADAVYEDFTGKVAEGRNLPLEQVQEIARGRVWTGADAMERGLVDQLGGFWTAAGAVRELAGIEPDVVLQFREYPHQQGFFDRVGSFFAASSAGFSALRGLEAVMSSPPAQALLTAAREAPSGQAELRAVGLPD
jgi:protease-4